jgi:MurNAc alpha-1-phosphate uridylyltransferase
MTSTKRPTRAFVLAAGKGERMRPLTETRPKPLVTVAGKALIDHVLDRLADAHIGDAIVNVHYLASQIEDHLRDRQNPKITISDERGELLDTGGGVVKALSRLGAAPFLIHNSDSIWIEGMGSNLDRLIAAWDDTSMDGLLLVAPIATSIGYDGLGDFQMDTTGRLTRQTGARLAPFVFAGVSIAHPRLFDDAPNAPFSLNKVWSEAIAKGRLYGVRLEGIWMHVGTPDAIGDAENAIATSMAAGSTLPGED